MSGTLRKGRSSCPLFCMAPPSGQQYLMISSVKGDWLIIHEALNGSTYCTLKWGSLAGDCSTRCGWGLLKALAITLYAFSRPKVTSTFTEKLYCILLWPFHCCSFYCFGSFFTQSLLSIQCFCFSSFSILFCLNRSHPHFLSLLLLHPEVSRDALKQPNTTPSFGHNLPKPSYLHGMKQRERNRWRVCRGGSLSLHC